MAVATWLRVVSEKQLEDLGHSPDLFDELAASGSHHTYFAPSINYFLTGDAYPGDHALAPMLHGATTIPYPKLENGNFGTVAPKRAEELAHRLAEVDLDELKARIEDADLDDLIDQAELDDLELIEHDDVPTTIINEVTNLAAFYDKVAKAGHGVVMYTT